VTSSRSSLQAIKQTPLCSQITTPIPIRREGENRAASTLIRTVPSGGGDHRTWE
jgi:hypothetical protein